MKRKIKDKVELYLNYVMLIILWSAIKISEIWEKN